MLICRSALATPGRPPRLSSARFRGAPLRLARCSGRLSCALASGSGRGSSSLTGPLRLPASGRCPSPAGGSFPRGCSPLSRLVCRASDGVSDALAALDTPSIAASTPVLAVSAIVPRTPSFSLSIMFTSLANRRSIFCFASATAPSFHGAKVRSVDREMRGKSVLVG